MSVLIILIITLSSLFSGLETARILAVFPTPPLSHQVVFQALVQELANNGHDIVFITPEPVFSKDKTLGNITEIEIHGVNEVMKKLLSIESKGNSKDPVRQFEIVFKMTLALIDSICGTVSVQKLVDDKSVKFDLLLVESLFRPGLVFSHIFKTPVILVSSYGPFFNNYALVGAPDHSLLYSSVARQRNINLTLWEKVNEVYNYYSTNKLYNGKYAKLEDEKLKQHFGKDIPSVKELVNYIDMLFVNINPIFEGIRPLPPSVVHLGGLHMKPWKELPQDFKTYLDASTHGVIYFSLGNTADTSVITEEKLQIIMKVFSKLPYNVLMKWNDNLPSEVSNVRVEKWLPQADLLRHPNIKLFITQAGLQSTDEAIAAGVPMIGIPLAFDQFHNAEKYEHHKIGLKLDFESLTEEDFSNAIITVVENESYRQNIIRLRELMLDQPQRPLERAVWWTEHVLRHGGAAHLRSPAANISWTQYLEIELILYLFIAFVVIAIYVCYCFLSFFYLIMGYLKLDSTIKDGNLSKMKH